MVYRSCVPIQVQLSLHGIHIMWSHLSATLIVWFTDRVAPPKYSPLVKEAAQSEVIGAVALGLVVAVVGAVVAADVPALLMAFHHLRDIFAAQ